MYMTNPSLIQEIKKQCNQLETIVLHHFRNRNNDLRHRKLVQEYLHELSSKRNLLKLIKTGGF